MSKIQKEFLWLKNQLKKAAAAKNANAKLPIYRNVGGFFYIYMNLNQKIVWEDEDINSLKTQYAKTQNIKRQTATNRARRSYN